MNPEIAISRRLRSTPFTSRVNAAGVKAYTVYNHMLLANNFRGVEQDYWHLRQHVQVWDVSCERQIQLKGPDAYKLTQLMTPRDLSKAKDDQCFYVPLCDEAGKIINDPIAIHVSEDTWWLSIADSDVMLWAKGLATGLDLNVEVSEPDVWPLAIQGPKAETLMSRVFGDTVNDIRFFRYKRLDYKGHPFIVARSGWSKQGGFEVYVDNAALGQQLWDELFEKGEDLQVGPGCPNAIERVESGLLSFGNDMDYNYTPLQCGLDKYCQLDNNLPSLSVAALAAQKAAGIPSKLMGLVVDTQDKEAIVLANSVVTLGDKVVGEITSSSPAGAYHAFLAFANVDIAAINAVSENVALSLRIMTTLGDCPVHCVSLPFDFATLNLAPKAPAQS